MSIEEIKEIANAIEFEWQGVRDMLKHNLPTYTRFSTYVKIQDWLLTHGYCINPEWVKAGWVELTP